VTNSSSGVRVMPSADVRSSMLGVAMSTYGMMRAKIRRQSNAATVDRGSTTARSSDVVICRLRASLSRLRRGAASSSSCAGSSGG
jgi:hypothetical protein